MANDQSNAKNWLGPYADAEVGAAALRAAERPGFLASALAGYLHDRQWTPDKLAVWLRCAPGQLAALGLCRRPDPAAPEFSEQVTQIVVHFQLDYWNLRRLLEDMALPEPQRHSLWQSESLNPAHGSADFLGNLHSAEEVFGMFDTMQSAQPQKASMPPERASSQDTPRWDAVLQQPGSPVEVTTAARRQSWLSRLLAAIRSLFTRKS